MDTPRNDGGARALLRLGFQLRNKPRLAAIIRSYAEVAQEADAALYTLYSQRMLATSVGDMLDVYGRLVGEPRAGRDDAAYRIRIQARMLLNRSNGTAEELLALTRLLLPAGRTVRLEEYFPATVLMRIEGGEVEFIDELYRILNEARSGGVRLLVTSQNVPDSERFTFAGGPGLGWGAVGGDDAPPVLGPITTPENQNGFTAPEVALPGPFTRPYKARLTIHDGGIFEYYFIGDDPILSRSAPMFAPGGLKYPAPLLRVDGTPSGITVTWEEGEPYVNDDTVHFDVTYRPRGGRFVSVRG